jgi:tetratricopeptide (TPR) repeat protein
MFGFGFSKEKSRANAEKYLQSNKLQNAINEYEKILQVEPNDLAILNTVGDIYARLGQNEKAIERFRVIAESYTNDGIFLKSIAMYRKIVKLDPNGMPAIEKLAELYRKQGLVSDARSMLLQAADAYTRKGQGKETLRVLKQLVLFDPENVQVIVRTADLMEKSNQKSEAREMLAQTASTLVDRNALDPAQKLLDRLIILDPGNLRAQELRAQVTLELGDAEKAIQLYEAIPDLDSRADGLRNLLAAYLKLGDLDQAFPLCRKLVTVHHDADGVVKVAARLYKENETLRALALYSEFSTEALAHDKEEVLAHLHGSVSRLRNNADALQTLYGLFQRAGESSMIAEVLELMAHASVASGQFDRARKAYKELIELEPDNATHVKNYRQVCANIDPSAPTASQPAARTEEQPRTLEEFLHGDEPSLPSQSYPPETEELITAALSEAELCESFSSKTRGINALESALQSAPDDLRLNNALANLYRQENDQAQAARCFHTMQRVLESMGEVESSAYYAKLAGSNETTTWEATGSEFTARDFDLSPKSAAHADTMEIDLSGEWESAFEEQAVKAPAAAPLPEPTPVPSTPAASSGLVAELIEEVRFCLAQQFWSEAETAIARLQAAAPNHPDLPALSAALRQARSGAAPAVSTPQPTSSGYQSFEIVEVSDNVGSPAPPPAAPFAAPTLSSLAADLEQSLGDDFTPVSKPRREPQPPAPPPPQPQPPRPQHQPSRPEVMPYMAAGAAEPVPAPMEEPEAPVLPSVFGDLLRDFEDDLAALQDDDSDPEKHFNLGIAFREMGLLDEAIGELQKVCKLGGRGLSPSLTQQAYIWLATCFVEKSVPEASFKWFTRALEAAPDEESRTAVNYELASAYEAAGFKREALDHFMEVYGNNIDYRDVATRIRDLRSSV